MAAEVADELRNTMDGIRNMSFVGAIASISALTQQFKVYKNTIGDYRDMVESAKMFLDPNSSHYSPDGAGLDWEGKAVALENYNLQMADANSLITEGTGIFGKFATTSTGAMAAAVAAMAVIAAEVALIIASIKNALAISKQIKKELSEAKNIGLDLRTYQEWGYILESVGVEADKLSDFLKTLADEQNAVREGSEDITAAFNKLGLSAEQVSGMSQGELFEKTVLGLQNVENEVERTSIAYKIFGEDAANLTSIVAMNNEELKDLINNFSLLGGYASDSLVEKSTTLQYSLQNLSTAWQGLKNTLAEFVMPAVNAVVNGLTKAIAVVNMFIRAMFGWDLVAKSTKSTGNATSSIGGYTSGVKAATAAVEKLKRTTMGFDELNIVSAPSTSGGSGSGDSGSSGGGFSTDLGDMASTIKDLNLDKWVEKIGKFKETIRLLTPVVLTAVGLIGGIACLATGNILAGIALLGMAGIGIAIGIESGAWGDIFGAAGKAIKSGFETIKNWFNTKIKPVFTKDYWTEKFGKIKTSAQEKLEEIKTSFNEKWTAIKGWFSTNVSKYFTKDYWLVKFACWTLAAAVKIQELKDKFSAKWTEIKDWYNTNIKKYFTQEYWVTVFATLVLAAALKINEVKTTMSNKWTEIKNWFSTNVGKYFTKDYWTNKFDSIRAGAATLKDKITGVFTGVGSKVGEVVSGAVKGAINGIFTSIENKVNFFINMINGAIVNINKIPGVNIKTLSRLSIPRLATGGITTGSTIANIGENGREAVLPLEHNTAWMDTLADRIASRNNTPSKIVLTVDGRELGWASINGINGITKQTGGLQLQLV